MAEKRRERAKRIVRRKWEVFFSKIEFLHVKNERKTAFDATNEHHEEFLLLGLEHYSFSAISGERSLFSFAKKCTENVNLVT